jgi:hypothetical protein
MKFSKKPTPWCRLYWNWSKCSLPFSGKENKGKRWYNFPPFSGSFFSVWKVLGRILPSYSTRGGGVGTDWRRLRKDDMKVWASLKFFNIFLELLSSIVSMKCITTVSNVSKSRRYDKPSLLWTPPPPVISSCKTSYTNFQRRHSKWGLTGNC